MPVIPCKLDHDIHLVIAPQKLADAYAQAPTFVPRRPEDLITDLTKLAAFGIATRLDEKGWIIFYAPTYAIVTKLTNRHRDAYDVKVVRPLTLSDHTQLCRKAINLQVRKWYCHPSYEALATVSRTTTLQSGHDMLSQLWETLAPPRPPNHASEPVTPPQQTFLDIIDQIIDATESLENEKATRNQFVPYSSVEAVAAFRSVGDTYAFRFQTPPPFEARSFVRITPTQQGLDGSSYAGLVVEVSENLVTVRFRRQLDLNRLPSKGLMQTWSLLSAYEIKRAAVRTLHSGMAKNGHMLKNVAEGCFAPYPAPTLGATPALNDAQHTALKRAELVPDMLLVLGPPGTGKTHTIRAMVRTEAQRHKRVLISSQSNAAVDNVLEDLVGTKDLRVVRVGRFERTADKIKAYLIDEQARKLQAESKARITHVYRRLTTLSARWNDIAIHLVNVQTRVHAWREANDDVQTAHQALERWHKDETQRRIPTLMRMAADVRRHHTATVRYARRAERWAKWIRSVDYLHTWHMIALLGTFLVTWGYRRYRQAEQRYAAAVEQFRVTRVAYQDACDDYQHHLTASPAVLPLKTICAAAETHARTVAHEIRTKLTTVVVLFQDGLKDVPTLPEVLTPDTADTFIQRGLALQEQITQRSMLLKRWWSLLEYRRQALYPALIQAADVVGATCIGIATDMRFDDLDFHLAIIDEAGQIAAPELLVPLARAERAVLVGDHKQLPPLVDKQLIQRLNNEGALPLVTKSLFEILFEQADEDHKVLLDKQYRLPPLIAEFVKDHVYAGRYSTERIAPYNDPMFAKPLVFIDTRTNSKRHEVRRQKTDEDRRYVNLLEVKLIVYLVERYAQAGMKSIGVIVPYRAQVELVQEELHKFGPTLGLDPNEMVATVDSFQGKEREVIILGFTRSNSQGRVGFLCEWRRLNVSITRAMRQLILIGDGATLTYASDATALCDNGDGRVFARLVAALIDYTKTYGQYLPPEDVLPKARF